MLRDEPNRTYFIYPSWADLSYRWEDLPRLLADPLNSGYFDELGYTEADWRRVGYPSEIKPATLLSGPGGGGIIYADFAYPEKWLPANILNKEANLCLPSGLIPCLERLRFHVHYLEPHDSPEWYLLTGKKPKLYVCGASVEHVESDPESVYWLIVYKKAKRRLKGLDDVPHWAEGFGLTVTDLESVPQRIAEETADWVVDPQWNSAWFSVQGDNDLVGYNFAIALYIGLRLQRVAGPQMACIHSVSQLETKINVRRNWWRH
jgi:hypothetical protein